MSRMNLYHVKSTVFAQFTCCFIRFYNFEDQLFRHFLHFSDRRYFMARSICHIASVLITANAGKSAVFSSVGKLDVGVCSRVVDRARRLCHSLFHTKRIQLQLLVM